MTTVFLTLASAKEEWAGLVQELYQEKINHFAPFKIHALKPQKKERSNRDERVRLDSEQILAFLNKDDFCILFDERGRSFSSEDFSKNMGRALESGRRRIVFIIGGAYGVTSEVRDRADLKITLAPFVLNHLVAQTVALEQIYRSWTIIRGLPYHNA